MSPTGRRFGRWRPAAIVAAALGLALAALVIAFDWNWVRPSLERYLAEKSQRSVRIGDFHVSFSRSLDPTLRFRTVRIDNAPWADPRPFIDAGELRATFPLSSLIHRRPAISHLVVIDAEIDLERQADGLRNWRLIRPDDRGPMRVRLMSIEAVRSRIRFAHRGLGIDVQTAATPITEAAPWTTQVAFEGTFRGAPFSGVAQTGPEITFLDTRRAFPLRGHAVSNGARLEVDGKATDLFELAGIDAKVALRAPSLAPLKPLVGDALPAAPPIELGGHLVKNVDAMSMADLSAKIGATRIAGAVSYERGNEARRLRADLASRVVRVEDLRWTAALARVLVPERAEPAAGSTDRVVPASDRSAGMTTPPAAAAATTATSAAAATTATVATAERDASAAAVSPPARERLDAEIRLQVDRLSAATWPAASSLDLTARLADGVLAVTPLAFGIGNGRASGRFNLDANRVPAEAQLRVDLRDLKLETLLASVPEEKRVAGALSGVIDLIAQGRTPDAWLASAAGTVSARLRGGSLSRRLDAQLGLSGSRFLRSLFGGAERVPIRCALAELELRAGKARAQALRLETDSTHVSGLGALDLKSGALDLLLTPSPNRDGLLELRKSIQVQRKPGGKLAYKLVDTTPSPRSRSCAEHSP